MKKKMLFTFMAFLLCIISYLLLSESFLYFYFDRKPTTALLQEATPPFLSDWLTHESRCPFAVILITHPTLGYVQRHTKDINKYCQEKDLDVNNIGLNSNEDLPVVKNKNEFRIMLLGGSVAQQLSFYVNSDLQKQPARPYIEYYLNKHYVSPTGYPFVVSAGAIGGWAFPNQIIMTLMYAERLDAIISLDGYNEANIIQSGKRFESVIGAQSLLAAYSKNSFFHTYSYLMRELYTLNSKPLFKKSYNLVVFYKLAALGLNKFYINDKVIDEFTSGATEPLNFPLPTRMDLALKQYERYMKNLHQLAESNKLHSIHFLQPSRHQGKTLTPKELATRTQDNVTSGTMKELQTVFFRLRRQGFPVYDLTNIFEKTSFTIYRDTVHFEQVGGISPGNEIMVKAMAKQIQKQWKLKEK